MSVRENRHPIRDLIIPEHALISVSDKTGLAELVQGLARANSRITFYSTGGTGAAVLDALKETGEAGGYMPVEMFTGTPEMEGGLVKTLDPKIHAGLLGERGNPAHIEYLEKAMLNRTGTRGVYFDMMVGNLYPFEEAIAKAGCTPETARANIDIGGPAMMMASAKNWHSVAVLSSPRQYGPFLEALERQGGTTAEQRFELARAAMTTIGKYRGAIAKHFRGLDFKRDVLPTLRLEGE